MQKPIEKYKIDRFDSIVRGNAAMGCGLQYICRNAPREALPAPDDGGGVLFTADCVLDNRSQLAALLGAGADTPDGGLLYRAWRRWGRDCNQYLRGSYSFAAYDYRENTLMLSADHVFSRSIYYLRQGTRLYFSTLIAPILEALPAHPAPNRCWIADYLSIDNLAVVSEPRETIYQGVLKPEAGEFILFSREGEQRHIYWNPFTAPSRKLADDDACRERFLELMASAAGEIAETGAQAGIYLSGGLDSGAVAAAVAPVLAEEGRELYGYTSVPFEGYKSPYNRHYIVDEREGVERLAQMYPNIRPRFCPLTGMDAANGLPDIAACYETPLKSISNNVWLMEIGRQAASDGVRVMLNGQMGNVTISWGDIYTAVHTLLCTGHPLRALWELNAYGKRCSVSRKGLVKDCLWAFRRNEPPGDVLEDTFVSREFSTGQGSGERILRERLFSKSARVLTLPRMRELFYNKNALSLVGETETKLGLLSGFVIRDITKDKRIFEFCLSAPLECFVRDGVTRRLVRGYMEDMLPPETVGDVSHRGFQSADWAARLGRRWEEAYPLIRDGCLHPSLAPFIDKEKTAAALDRLGGGVTEREGEELQRLFYLYSLSMILRRFPDSENGM